jgi:two-component system chemotaxis response regulator CheB
MQKPRSAVDGPTPYRRDAARNAAPLPRDNVRDADAVDAFAQDGTTPVALKRDIIVIGGSAGGVEAVTQILSDLSADLPAAVFVVVHTSPHSRSMLPQIFSRVTKLSVGNPLGHELIRRSHVYIAPPDFHMLLERDRVKIARGPLENHTRPAIDPLFRSAALHHGPRVIGVILTGFLDDGTAGLVAVKARGGMAVIQDPADAREPSMPRSALDHAEPDYLVPLSMIGPTLTRLAGERIDPPPAPPTRLLDYEARTAASEPQMIHGDEIAIVGEPSMFSCPECNGVLWEVKGEKPLRFRCRTGHAFSAHTLMADQTSSIETALYTAMRALEESAALARRMAGRSKNANTAAHLVKVADDRTHQAEDIRRALSEMASGFESEPV